jgi:ribose transport system ATP-binding protein
LRLGKCSKYRVQVAASTKNIYSPAISIIDRIFMEKAIAFEVSGLHKSFGPVEALRNVSLKVIKGEIHAVVGQNGAGKSTLVKMLIGVHPTDSAQGTISLGGETVSFANPSDAIKKGVGYVPQEIELVDNLTVAENIFAGSSSRKIAFFNQTTVQEKAQDLLTQYGIDLPVDALAASLSSAQRQLVMIIRALSLKPSVLLLDEPTTSLANADAKNLSITLQGLKKRGVTMIYITHRIQEVLDFCDAATVLRDGTVAASFTKDEMHEDAIVQAMIGRSLTNQARIESRLTAREPILEVANLCAPAHNPQSVTLRNVSFKLHRGEILGLAGLVGSGRSEVLNSLFGRIPSTGRIILQGEDFLPKNPSNARAHGMSLLSEDRKRDGLLFNLNLIQNVTAGSASIFSHGQFINRSSEKTKASKVMNALSVKAASYLDIPSQLSGGNQQKLLFARVLIENPKILLLDEPTKGVDVGVREEIYNIIRSLRDQGTSIIVVSSDLKELIEISDRLVVLSQGEVTDEFDRSEGSESRILIASSGLVNRAG